MVYGLYLGLEGVSILLRWGLCMCYDDAWTLWEMCKEDGRLQTAVLGCDVGLKPRRFGSTRTGFPA